MSKVKHNGFMYTNAPLKTHCHSSKHTLRTVIVVTFSLDDDSSILPELLP